MSEPTYLLWTPRTVAAETALRFNVTPLSAIFWPSGPAAFYDELLADMGVAGDVESWQVMPFRSRYHGDPDAADWRDRWKRNWRVTVRCAAEPATDAPFEEGYETEAFSDQPRVHDGEEVHAMVLADFATVADAEAAREEIGRIQPVSGFELFPVETSFWQLQVDLGSRPSTFFARDSDAADRVEEICRRLGGWPTFDERVAVLG